MRCALLLVLLTGCTTARDFDRALEALQSTGDGATLATTGIAGVATKTQELLGTVRHEVAGLSREATELSLDASAQIKLTAESVRGEAAALESFTRSATRAIDEARPGIVAATENLSAALGNAAKIEAVIFTKVDAPLPRSMAAALWSIAAAIVALFLHALYTHFVIRKHVRRTHGTGQP